MFEAAPPSPSLPPSRRPHPGALLWPVQRSEGGAGPVQEEAGAAQEDGQEGTRSRRLEELLLRVHLPCRVSSEVTPPREATYIIIIIIILYIAASDTALGVFSLYSIQPYIHINLTDIVNL